jgi:putative membrane protein
MRRDERDSRLRITGRSPAPPSGKRRGTRRAGATFAAGHLEPAYDGTRTQWFTPVDMKLLAKDAQLRLAYDRTHLANERTFAAWLRTGLSVAAGGIAVAHLVPEPSRNSLVALALGAAFVLLGVGILVYGARRYARSAAALNRDSGAPSPVAPRAVYLLASCISILLLAVLLFLWTHQGRTPTDPRDASRMSRMSRMWSPASGDERRVVEGR